MHTFINHDEHLLLGYVCQEQLFLTDLYTSAKKKKLFLTFDLIKKNTTNFTLSEVSKRVHVIKSDCVKVKAWLYSHV